MASPPDGPIVFLLGNRTSQADFERFAVGNDWLAHDERPGLVPKAAYEKVWVTPDRGTSIHYVDDPTPRERYVVVQGPHAGSVASQMCAANLDVRTREDVFNRGLAAATTPERTTVAWQLAVTTPLHDKKVQDVLKSLYENGNELVRSAVVDAIGYRGWAESRPFLEDVASKDASAELREKARKIVDAWWGDETGGAGSEETAENN